MTIDTRAIRDSAFSLREWARYSATPMPFEAQTACAIGSRTILSLCDEVDRLRAALEKISKFGATDSHGFCIYTVADAVYAAHEGLGHVVCSICHTPDSKMCDCGLPLREKAERRVLAVRGSYDAPGFEACVDAELAALHPTEDAQGEG